MWLRSAGDSRVVSKIEMIDQNEIEYKNPCHLLPAEITIGILGKMVKG
jgi:hypothetical protein